MFRGSIKDPGGPKYGGAERFFVSIQAKDQSPNDGGEKQESLPRIERQVEIRATKDRVWEIIANLESEPDYWYGTREVRTISKNGNEIEREITQNFRNHKILQKATLRPKESVEIRYLKGLTEGIKAMSIESPEEKRQILKVSWNIRFTGIYYLLTPYLKGHTEKGTVAALQSIKNASENEQEMAEVKSKGGQAQLGS